MNSDEIRYIVTGGTIAFCIMIACVFDSWFTRSNRPK